MGDQAFQTLTYAVNENGVAVITIDVKDRPVNVLTPEFYRDFHDVVRILSDDESAVGAVIQSGKKTFFAGGDLKRIVNFYAMKRSPEQAYKQSRDFTTGLRKLELCGKPVAVAINGSAMGGGLELALGCNYRVVVDEPKVFMALPEVTLGLLPGAGGTQRLPRIIGIEKAADLILSGRAMTPTQALDLGVVDRVVSRENLFAVAEELVLNNSDANRPWDQRGYTVPGGVGLSTPRISALFQKLNTRVGVDFCKNYPAPPAALRAIYKGTSTLSMDAALEIESREFSKLTGLVETRNIVRTMFLNKGAMDRLAAKPDGAASQRIKTIYVSQPDAVASLEKSFSKASIDRVAAPNSATQLQIITDELTIEKLEVLAGAALQSTLCITSAALLEAICNSETLSPDLRARVIGVNFPCVDVASQCLEIGLLSDEQAQGEHFARVLDFSKRIRKTPTVQKFSAQWLSKGCVNAYRDEAKQLVQEGCSVEFIENCARFIGLDLMPFAEAVPAKPTTKKLPAPVGVDAVQSRLLMAQALVAVDYLAAGKIRPADADVLSILGWGFPSWTGGVISYVDSVEIEAFVMRCDQLAEQFGDRFEASAWLREQIGIADSPIHQTV